jgi:hypothetical protein
MIICFSASTRKIKEDIGVYRKILHTIRSLGHVVARDWVETSWIRESQHSFKQSQLQGMDWNIVREAEAAIESSELIIAEASDISTFGVGYEVALALQRRKPVLLLVNKNVAARSYASGLSNELITFKKYDDDSIEKIVENFIRNNTIKKKDLRFNFVIDRQIHNHLRLKSFNSGKTKAEVLRDLLLKDMEKN